MIIAIVLNAKTVMLKAQSYKVEQGALRIDNGDKIFAAGSWMAVAKLSECDEMGPQIRENAKEFHDQMLSPESGRMETHNR